MTGGALLMSYPVKSFRAVRAVCLLFFGVLVSAVAQTNTPLRVMSANITSGNNQRYEAPGIRIFQGLKPDVVAIQEFNYASTNGLGINTPEAFREMLDTAVGPDSAH